MSNTRQTGIDGEYIGSEYLLSRGYAILERNFRTFYGEIDLIARDGGTLVFVEIKRRRSASFGRPEEAVHRRKQERIVRSALHYIKMKRLQGTPLRFDVLAIGPGSGDIELITSAFGADGYSY